MTDLDPTSGNRIIAADVVDDVLTFKRYDGTSESFPIGVGVETENPILDWYTTVTALADDANSGGSTEYGTLYAADGSTLLEFDGDDLDGEGFEVGDDYILSRSGADLLYFKTPGLYLADVNASAMVDVGIRADYTSSLSSSYLSMYSVDSVLAPMGQLLIKVKETDVSSVGNLVSSFSMTLVNKTGSPQDLHAESWVSKIG